MESLVEYYNCQLYYKAFDNIAHTEVYCDKEARVLNRKEKIRKKILRASKEYNQKLTKASSAR